LEGFCKTRRGNRWVKRVKVMKDLASLRRVIDYIDKEIINLFEKRMETVIKIAQYKEQNGLPILNESREKEVIEKNISYLKNKSLQKEALDFFNYIMNISREIQARQMVHNICKKGQRNVDSSNKPKCTSYISRKDKLRIGFQGVQGSFSEQALIEYFGEDVTPCNVIEFEDLFKALRDNEIDYGVLPIENSSTGGISEVYDLLRKYGFYITGERCVKVDHNLLGIKGAKIENITEVYSHPQALQQSSEFFKAYPEMKLIPYSNTASSAKLVKDENSKEKAAVASKKAAQLYNLDIIRSNINYNKNNYTRFAIIGRNLEVNSSSNKISIVISVAHKPGSLCRTLSHFAKNNLNMSKIESRPIVDKPWEYFFYIDFEGNLNDAVVRETIECLKKDSIYFKLLGNYEGHNGTS
jgi:chorismate mutase/prephenate dehydratase